MKKFIINKKGFILFSIVLLSFILIALIIPLIAWSVNEFSWTTRSFKSLRALNLADAGAELAVWEIIYNDAQFTGWSGVDPKIRTLNSFTDNLGESIGDIAINVKQLSSDTYFVTSIGFVPNEANPVVKKTVKVKVFPHSLFNNGVFGYNSVILRGNTLIDSYDSGIGPYSPITAGNNADVGTNGTLTLLENTVVNGDLFVGPNGEILEDPLTSATGERYYSGENVDLGDIPFEESYFITLPSQGNLFVEGNQSFTILSGDYRYENITVQGKASLTIDNSTRIYVHNNFYIGGQAVVYTNEDVEIFIGGDGDFAGQGIVNATGIAGNLQIYGISAGTNFNFTGQNDFYGTFFAPESSIYLAGGANFFGAVVGDTVELAGTIKFHYDEALSREGPFKGYDIAYWQED